MNKKKILKSLEKILKRDFLAEPTGHDYYHFDRVRNLALRIAKEEKKGDLFLIQLGALMHDLADWKFHKGNFNESSKVGAIILRKLGADSQTITNVGHIVDNVSFKGEKEKNGAKTIEAKIVQDADRLEALGAIGIARVMATGSYLRTPIYDPRIKPKKNMTKAEYKKSLGKNTSINHFYEKLLLIKNLLNTKAAKKIAAPRHAFIKIYLKQFFAEWKGQK